MIKEGFIFKILLHLTLIRKQGREDKHFFQSRLLKDLKRGLHGIAIIISTDKGRMHLHSSSSAQSLQMATSSPHRLLPCCAVNEAFPS